jgi:hypothetical protein
VETEEETIEDTIASLVEVLDVIDGMEGSG